MTVCKGWQSEHGDLEVSSISYAVKTLRHALLDNLYVPMSPVNFIPRSDGQKSSTVRFAVLFGIVFDERSNISIVLLNARLMNFIRPKVRNTEGVRGVKLQKKAQACRMS
jgi:hypothetical protein